MLSCDFLWDFVIGGSSFVVVVRFVIYSGEDFISLYLNFYHHMNFGWMATYVAYGGQNGIILDHFMYFIIALL